MKTQQNLKIKRIYVKARHRCLEEAYFYLKDIRIGMSAPSGLYNNRGETRSVEQEFVYNMQRFTISEVVLTEDFF